MVSNTSRVSGGSAVSGSSGLRAENLARLDASAEAVCFLCLLGGPLPKTYKGVALHVECHSAGA